MSGFDALQPHNAEQPQEKPYLTVPQNISAAFTTAKKNFEGFFEKKKKTISAFFEEAYSTKYNLHHFLKENEIILTAAFEAQASSQNKLSSFNSESLGPIRLPTSERVFFRKEANQSEMHAIAQHNITHVFTEAAREYKNKLSFDTVIAAEKIKKGLEHSAYFGFTSFFLFGNIFGAVASALVCTLVREAVPYSLKSTQKDIEKCFGQITIDEKAKGSKSIYETAQRNLDHEVSRIMFSLPISSLDIN